MAVDDLATFLRARRAALRPEAIGLSGSRRRRVPGLRREELAQLAGVSVAYYTRLEQGHSVNASPSVLDAIARALQLDAVAHDHLHNLARPPRPHPPARTAGPAVSAGVVRLIAALHDIPACVLGPRMEILAWTRLGHALLAGHLDAASPASPELRPNMALLVFLDPHTRELFVDYDEKAHEAVAFLRRSAGRRPDDPALASIIGTLAMRSKRFVDLWAAAPVQDKTSGTRRFAHPLIGPLELDFQALAVPHSDGQLIVTFTAPAGSASAAGLQILAREPNRTSRAVTT
jgi:transcriptional regulator with XRE-family HTH domain